MSWFMIRTVPATGLPGAVKNAVQPSRVLAGTLVSCNCLQYQPSSLASLFGRVENGPEKLALIVGPSNKVVVAFPSFPKSREATSSLSSGSESD